MKNRWIIIAIFLVMVGFQWYIPWNMSRGDYGEEGNTFKFEMIPFDRNDPFRGKYLQLRFEAERVKMDTLIEFTKGEEVYALMDQDSAGFVRIFSIEREEPADNVDFVLSRVHRFIEKDTILLLDFTFDRYYLNESVAQRVEESFQSRPEISEGNYAVVKVTKGRGTLEEVFLDGKSIREWK